MVNFQTMKPNPTLYIKLDVSCKEFIYSHECPFMDHRSLQLFDQVLKDSYIQANLPLSILIYQKFIVLYSNYKCNGTLEYVLATYILALFVMVVSICNWA